VDERSLTLDSFPQRLPDNRQKFDIVHRLFKKSLGSSLNSALTICSPGAAGYNNDGNYRQRRHAFEPVHHYETIARRQSQVQQDQVRLVLTRFGNCGKRIHGKEDIAESSS
jgi:hypothetical protein